MCRGCKDRLHGFPIECEVGEVGMCCAADATQESTIDVAHFQWYGRKSGHATQI